MKKPMARKKMKRTESKEEELQVDRHAQLLSYLLDAFPEKKKKIRAVFKSGQVSLNGKRTTQYDTEIFPGDKLSVRWVPEVKSILDQTGIRIIYQDDDLVVIDKPAGLLSVGTEKDKDNSAYRHVNSYLQMNEGVERIYVLHRLDRDTSGVMIFAKKRELQDLLQKNWDEYVIARWYSGVVEGIPNNQQGTVESYLFEDPRKVVQVSRSPERGKKAITHYQVQASNDTYSLVHFQLETGRKNQIRVHMRQLGCPIVGDEKYGSTVNPVGRLALHAYHFTIRHPISGEELSFQSDVPASFARLSSE